MNRYGVSPEKERELLECMSRLGIREQDLEESFVKSGGPGGQRVNKAATAVRIKHLPSGLEVKSQQSRSQALNRFYARRMICEKFEKTLPGAEIEEDKERERIRKAKQRSRRRVLRKKKD